MSDTQNAIKTDMRINALLNAVPNCYVVADIGSDHGMLPAKVILAKKAERVIVADISVASLSKAQKLFTQLNLNGYASFVVSDGLQNINQNIDCIVIAGMGGNTIINILSKDINKLSNILVLEPNTKIIELRKFLNKIGYAILHEHLVRVSGFIYNIITAEKGMQSLSEKDVYLGKVFDVNDSQMCIEYLTMLKSKALISLRGANSAKNINESVISNLNQKLIWIQEKIGKYSDYHE